jgi:hypothetical protein
MGWAVAVRFPEDTGVAEVRRGSWAEGFGSIPTPWDPTLGQAEPQYLYPVDTAKSCKPRRYRPSNPLRVGVRWARVSGRG